MKMSKRTHSILTSKSNIKQVKPQLQAALLAMTVFILENVLPDEEVIYLGDDKPIIVKYNKNENKQKQQQQQQQHAKKE